MFAIIKNASANVKNLVLLKPKKRSPVPMKINMRIESGFLSDLPYKRAKTMAIIAGLTFKMIKNAKGSLERKIRKITATKTKLNCKKR